MHYLTYLIIPTQAIKDNDSFEIEGSLYPFMQKSEGELWDWWQIGGRWTGHLSGYDPEKDETNIETCTYCQAPEHKRFFNNEWIECNVCKGTGKRAKWPTGWALHQGDIQPAEILLKKDEPPHYLIMPCGWLSFENRESDQAKRKRIAKKHKKQFIEVIRPFMNGEFSVIVLDLHN